LVPKVDLIFENGIGLLEESECFPVVLDLVLPDGGAGLARTGWLFASRVVSGVCLIGIFVVGFRPDCMDEPESLILAQSERWRNA
jgi:hypothetical protein